MEGARQLVVFDDLDYSVKQIFISKVRLELLKAGCIQ